MKAQVVFALLALAVASEAGSVRPKRGFLHPYSVRTIHSAFPVHVRNYVPLAVPRPFPVKVVQHVPVAVPRAVPVTVHKPYAVEVPRAVEVPVPRAVPFEVPHHVPVELPRAVPIHFEQPLDLYKKPFGGDLTEAFVPTAHGFKAL